MAENEKPRAALTTPHVTAEEWLTIQSMAKALAESKFFFYVSNRETIYFTAHQLAAMMLLGRDLRIGDTVACFNFRIIHGKPAPSTNLMHGLACRGGNLLEPLTDQCDETRAVVECKRPEWSSKKTVTFTMEEATKLGYAGKNPLYKSQPMNMLLQRAIAAAARLVAPDQLAGIYSDIELQDMEERPVEPVKTDPPKRQPQNDVPKNDQPVASDENVTVFPDSDDAGEAGWEEGLSPEQEAQMNAALTPASELAPPERDTAQNPGPNRGFNRTKGISMVGKILLNRSGEKHEGKWPVSGVRSKDRDAMAKYLAEHYGESSSLIKDWSDETLLAVIRTENARTERRAS